LGENTQQVLEILARERCSAILRTPHGEQAAGAMRAAVEGGFRVVEFTLNTPGALELVAEFAQEPELCVGAGTVLDLAGAEAARNAGARFLVSPHTDVALVEYAVRHDLVFVPGGATPSEMLAAHRAGAPVVKLFPGPADGPAWVRALLGPLPFLRIWPTSGVTLANAADFLRAGALGVGFVNCLFEPEDLRAGRFDLVRERARRLVLAVREAPRASDIHPVPHTTPVVCGTVCMPEAPRA
jgi:Entner-Doudoroff aldolase